MRKKLILGVFIAVLLIVLMIIGGQVIIRLYGSQTEKLINEHREINVLQDYKLSLNTLLVQLENLGSKQEGKQRKDIIKYYEDSKLKFENCRRYLTHRHKKAIWLELEAVANTIDSAFTNKALSNNWFSFETIRSLKMQIAKSLDNLNHLIDETKDEINVSERIRYVVIRHGTVTMLGVGGTLILVVLIGGVKFINKLTEPIRKLEKGADSIKAGNRQTRVNLYSGDEFEKLADTFNSMLDSLDETTVSKEYFQNIINSLYGALFVINEQGFIKDANNTSVHLFEYAKNALLKEHISLLFDDATNENPDVDLGKMNFKQKVDFFTETGALVSKSGKKIPVSINCTRVKSQENDNDEILIVAHDITEKVILEEQLAQNRKEIRLSINEAQEAERVRLAKELHDSLGQQLTGISYTVQKLHESKKYAADLVQSIINQVDVSIKETKKLSHNLIPIVLIEFGLVTAMQNLIDSVNKIGKTTFQYFHFDIYERLDDKLEKAIYRICQEGINNIIKHANAENATIQFFQSPEQFTVLIEDDGVGFEPKRQFSNKTDYKEGIGLLSIRERVHNFNGRLTIESQPGEGTEIIIELSIIKKKCNE